MSEFTQADRPLISILMAVYEPRMDWLREQLESLEAQTYSNLRLYICDDCSLTVPFTEIERCVEACIHSFPWTITRNEENLGSNGTFQRLTEEAEGEYFAYCDQDDIWLPEKLTVLREEMERSGALLVCSDMFIIDGNGKQVADSITKVRRRHVFRSGVGLAEELLISNFVTGCTMLVRAESARKTVPFCPYMVHDHYIALCCAAAGEILSLSRPLIRYRIHGGNQTGLMAGVKDKASYGEIRIEAQIKRFQWLGKCFPYLESIEEKISRRLEWSLARRSNWKERHKRGVVWKYRRFSPLTSMFELAAVYFPEWMFLFFIGLKRKNFV
ncbi:hypothetical protein N510_000656 [Firmicutes bacterium ASF500]|nr:hypothetical protein N510_000656 [Firmicutes bacterium ASF500]